MSKQNQHKPNVPELRFPEFTGEWEEKKVKEEFKVVSGITPLRSKKEFFDDNGIPWIKTMDLNNTEVKSVSERVSELAINKLNLKVIPKDTLLLAMYGGFNQIGRTGLLTFDATINQAISALLDIKKKHNAYFFQAYFNYNVNKWRRYAASSRKDPNITKKDIENFRVVFPAYNEQQKIGDFFSKLDQQIELEEKKLELLEEQKKGYMQKIFSQVLRFKDEDGNDYPEWGTITVGEIAMIGTGNKDTKDAEINGKYNFYVRSPRIEKINSYSFDGEAVLTVGDGVGVGKIFHYVNGKFDFHQRVYKISSFRNYYGKFFYYYFSFNFRREAQKYNAKTSVDSVRKEMISKMKVPLCNIEEQKNILLFLSALDRRKYKQREKLNLLKDLKKSFSQKMFV